MEFLELTLMPIFQSKKISYIRYIFQYYIKCILLTVVIKYLCERYVMEAGYLTFYPNINHFNDEPPSAGQTT